MAGPDTKNAETPYPIWGFDPPSPEPDTKKLDALLASLNGSAERFQTLWFSFLGLTLYLAIAALATTHCNLLLGEPQTLPILNIKVELLPFYVIAPLLYLVFHFYLLMMLALLARTAAEFDKQLRTTIAGEPEQERYRAQIGNALFLQLLVGMKGERAGVNAFLMGLIALITVVLAPLATLVLVQMMFLPYHHFRITWLHRAILAADAALIVVMTYRCFFPRGVRKAPLVLGAFSRKLRWATAMAFCVVLAVALAPFVDWLSFQQGRWAGEPHPSSFKEWTQWMHGAAPPAPEALPDYAATANGVVFGLFPDRLKLNDETIVGEIKLEETKKEIASRGGGFVPTIRLEERDLQAANLRGADLRGVSLENADIGGANLRSTRLDGARLRGAHMLGAQLDYSNMEAADLLEIDLHGALITGVKWQGVDLRGALLERAYLLYSHLEGAKLLGADLERAVLIDAQLQGAKLTAARLKQAVFVGGQLQAAKLTGADLAEAVLFETQLQGADLRATDLERAYLDHSFLFRTDIRNAYLQGLIVESTQTGMVRLRDDDLSIEPLESADVEKWSDSASEFATEQEMGEIVHDFDRLKPGFGARAEDAADQAEWAELTKQSLARDPDGRHYRERLATRLGDLACDPGGAPEVARALIGTDMSLGGRLAALGDQLETVRKRMKDGREKPESCPGVAGFTEEDWRALEALRPN
jgi:uncharacterized protein YjbI with pentapeptide repeats